MSADHRGPRHGRATRAARARIKLAEVLERLEVESELAQEIAGRLSGAMAERFVVHLERLWRGGPTPMTPR